MRDIYAPALQDAAPCATLRPEMPLDERGRRRGSREHESQKPWTSRLED